ncbi:MAG: hypothetical protein AAB706_00105 [Patescibacteria group bacterium]
MSLISVKELKVFKEPGVIAKEARWYFAKERRSGNQNITLKKAIELMLSQCEHSTNEQVVYEIAVGLSICHKILAKKQKQMDSPHLQLAQSVSTPRPQVRKTTWLPYSDD